jgi:transposase-like protein
MMVERGLSIAHTTILRWVRRYTPEFDKRWSRFSAQAGMSWRVDETYVRIRGQWAYLYRAVDSSGKTVDFRLSPRRNVASAKAFFRKAIRVQGQSPEKITLDGYAASHRAVLELQQHGELADLKELRFRCHHHSWSGAYASNSKRTVRLARSRRAGANSVRNLGSCPGCLS